MKMGNLPKIPNMVVALTIALLPGLAVWVTGAYPPDLWWWSAAVVVALDGLLRWLQKYNATNLAAMDPTSRPSFGAKLLDVVAGR
jgi:hypothetical protein